MKYLKLQKVSDDRSDKTHFTQIPIGSIEIQGFWDEEIRIGEQLLLYPSEKGGSPICWTSRVVKFDLENKIIETKNSTYKILE
jgi:hypothetical protein